MVYCCCAFNIYACFRFCGFFVGTLVFMDLFAHKSISHVILRVTSKLQYYSYILSRTSGALREDIV